jgi:hypothetical protein
MLSPGNPKSASAERKGQGERNRVRSSILILESIRESIHEPLVHANTRRVSSVSDISVLVPVERKRGSGPRPRSISQRDGLGVVGIDTASHAVVFIVGLAGFAFKAGADCGTVVSKRGAR